MTDVPRLSARFTEAIEMARRVHDGDAIKGTTTPYMTHLLDVCSLTLRHGGDEDQPAGLPQGCPQAALLPGFMAHAHLHGSPTS